MTRPQQKLKTALWCVAAVLGLLQAWAGRFYIEPDGVNYLDVAHAYLQHDWHNAINAYWSPFYSWVLALALWMTHVPLQWESTLLHLVNFVFYLLALICFAFFLDELIGHRNQLLGTSEESAARLILGYAIFIYGALELISLQTDTPDMFVFAMFFLATGILIRIHRTNGPYLLYAGLGIVLGVAYLSKTVMFILAFVFLGCSFFATRDWRRRSYGTAAAGLIFLLVSAPWIALLSKAKTRVTYGDVGRLAYADYINGLLSVDHWHGEIPGLGTPVHGTRILSQRPPIDEFGAPVAGTYPPWYDTTYWDEGITPHFDLRGQLKALATSADDYFHILSAEKGLLVGLLALIIFEGSAGDFFRRLGSLWVASVPALTALALYGLVHVETRYVGGAMAVLWCVMFSAVPLRAQRANDRLWSSVAVAAALVLSCSIAGGLPGEAAGLFHEQESADWQAAAALRQLGLQPGETVAILGKTTSSDYWAHLAQARVVADLPKERLDEYWRLSAGERSKLSSLFAGTGAKFLVTPVQPPDAAMGQWSRLGASGYYALFLPPLRFSQE